MDRSEKESKIILIIKEREEQEEKRVKQEYSIEFQNSNRKKIEKKIKKNDFDSGFVLLKNTKQTIHGQSCK